MTTTIVCDLDGPLLDGRHKHFRCYETILRRHGYEPIGLDEYWTLKRNRVNRRALLERSNAPVEFYDIYNTEWLSSIEVPEFLSYDRLQTRALQTLAAWKDGQKELVLATIRHNVRSLNDQLEALGISRYFDIVSLSPAKDGARGKAAGVRDRMPAWDASRSLWIGDTEVDVEAARILGCRVWAITDGVRSADFLASLHPDGISATIQDVDV
jgi:phosphoglycolate phosphatase